MGANVVRQDETDTKKEGFFCPNDVGLFVASRSGLYKHFAGDGPARYIIIILFIH